MPSKLPPDNQAFPCTFNLTRGILLSLFIHASIVAPSWQKMLTPNMEKDTEIIPFKKIEFEFYGAKEASVKAVIPSQLIENLQKSDDPPPDINSPTDTSLPDSHLNLKHTLAWQTSLNLDPTPIKNLTLPNEQDYYQKPTPSKTSKSLKKSSLETMEEEEDKKDYWQRIHNLIYTKLNFPPELKNKNIEDTIKIEITLNKQGQLVKTHIPPEFASRYEAFNREAILAIEKASAFFPPLPKSYPDETVTITVAIHFDNE